MRAVDQSVLGAPFGNCLEACFASLVGVPIDAVPDPRRVHSPARVRVAIRKRLPWIRCWLNARGLDLAWGRGFPPRVVARGWWIAGGPAERGHGHAVVYAGALLVHDPHPSRAGLLGVEHWYAVVPYQG